MDVTLPIADQVESATHEILDGQPNWSANIAIADELNRHASYGPPLLAALRKRLTHKKHSIGYLAIVLLESLVKNAPRNLLPLIASHDFLDELIHVLPKIVRDPHNASKMFARDHTRDIQAVERYDKILLCIESWARTFSTPPHGQYPIFGEVYRNLQRSGTHFPQPERDELAPVQTPPVSQAILAKKQAEHEQAKRAIEQSEHQRRSNEFAQRQRELQQMALRFRDADVRAAIETAQLFTDMLTESSPSEDLRKNELISSVYEALKPQAAKIQQRLAPLAAGNDEQTLAECLQANDACMEASSYFEGLLNGSRQRYLRPAPESASAASSSSRPSSRRSSGSALTAADASSSSPSKAAAPASKPPKLKAVPLIQPPPASGTPTNRKRSGADKSSPVVRAAVPSSTAAASVQQPPLDLLFSEPAPPAAAPLPTYQQEGVPNRASFASVPAYPSYAQPPPQQQVSPYRAVSTPSRGAFALPPPPAAAANVDFFTPTAASMSSHPHAAAAATPFDSPDPPGGVAHAAAAPAPAYDPFAELALRHSPGGHNHAAAPPSSQPVQAQPQQQPPKKKSVVEQFDLLSL